MPKPPMPPYDEEQEDEMEQRPDGAPEAPMPPGAGPQAPMPADGDPTAAQQGPEDEEGEDEEDEEDEDEDEDEGPYGRKSVDMGYDPDDALATDTEILKGIVNSAVRDAVAPLHAKIKRLETLVKGVPSSVRRMTEEIVSKGVVPAVTETPAPAKPAVQAAPAGKAEAGVEKGIIAQPGEDNRLRARNACAKALGLMRDKRASIPAFNDVDYAIRMGGNVPDNALKALVEQIEAAEAA